MQWIQSLTSDCDISDSTTFCVMCIKAIDNIHTPFNSHLTDVSSLLSEWLIYMSHESCLVVNY